MPNESCTGRANAKDFEIGVAIGEAAIARQTVLGDSRLVHWLKGKQQEAEQRIDDDERYHTGLGRRDEQDNNNANKSSIEVGRGIKLFGHRAVGIEQQELFGGV